ncbi:MAG: DUF7544 domain-containing protein [Candidatus Rokuibacteriota bacterium]
MTERPEIGYLAPLERAWARMVEQLFRPFDLAKWFVLGFACCLARLGQGGGPSFNFNVPADLFEDDADAATLDGLAGAFDPDDLFAPAAIGCLVLFLLALLVLIPLLMWLSARGQFMFLDGVVRRRAEIVEPWREFRREGNSLFLWQLAFALIALASLLLLAAPGVVLLIMAGNAGRSLVPGILLLVLPLLVWIVALVYIGFFLSAFVVPIMHRERLRTTAAWRVFLPVFKAAWPRFLLVGLFVLALHVAVAIPILIAGLATCCILFIVLIIPYLGTVALLPLWVTYRAFTLEWLAQFSPRFDFFASTSSTR